MSIINLDGLPARELIAQYIIELKGSGHMLPYSDYEYIEIWLREVSDNSDTLLLVLSEILPDYFGEGDDKKARRSLKGVHKKVIQVSREIKQRNY